MISFEWPYVLAAILPWGAFTIFLAFRNLKAFKQVAELTHPAKRSQITVYSSKTVFWLHYSLLFLLGLLLILAGSGMHRYVDGKIESRQPRVYIVLDGSLSMYANDGRYESKNKYLSRIEEAKEKAETLISLLPDALFGMYSFSGTAVLHSLPTSDHASLVSLIKNFEPHNIESSGSMISLPLKNILEMNEAGKQITLVLFSDGENPQEDTELENVLAQYEQRKVRIFTIGLGKDSLVKMNIFHPDDILHGEADKRVIAKFETRLNKDNLEMIADRTNADYWHADDVFDDSQIEKITEGDETIVDVDSIVKEDLTYLVMIFAMLVFLIELYYWPSLRVTAIKAAKTGILFILLLPMIRCQPDFLNAHYKNQDGIASDLQADFPQALSHFSESMAYKYRMHIPAYNQARVHLQTEKYEPAHQILQNLVVQIPEFGPAYYNDGLAVYQLAWKKMKNGTCYPKDAQTLIELAVDRFNTSIEFLSEDYEKQMANANAQQLKQLAIGFSQLPEECPDESQNQNEKDKNQENQNQENNKDNDKDKNQENKNENQKDKNESNENQEQNNENPKPRPLSDKEKQEIEKERRNLSNISNKDQNFRQSREQQMYPGQKVPGESDPQNGESKEEEDPEGESVGKGGRRVYW